MHVASDNQDNYDALIFDLFGVVIAFDDAVVYRRVAQHCAEPERAFLALRDLVSDPGLIRGRRTLADVHDQLAADLGLSLALPDFESVWRMPYSDRMPGMEALLRSLAQRYKLVLLSNVDMDYWRVVQAQHPELECFSEAVLSWQLGVAKPDLAAFAAAIRAARTPASRCFFVDDKRENIDAARAVGLDGHLFSSVEDLRVALDRRGIR